MANHTIVSYREFINSENILGRRKTRKEIIFDSILGKRKKKESLFFKAFFHIIGSNIFEREREREREGED